MRIGSLFCGIGGMELGVIGDFTYLNKYHYKKREGFDVKFAFDFNKKAIENYNKNFIHKAICADITQIKTEAVEYIDLLLGGFPCQPFSWVSRNPLGFKDSRGLLYKECLRFLADKQPKLAIFENVVGIRRFIPQIQEDIEKIGYNCQPVLVQFSEFELPQSRRRYLFFVSKNKLDLNFSPTEKQFFVDDVVCDYLPADWEGSKILKTEPGRIISSFKTLNDKSKCVLTSCYNKDFNSTFVGYRIKDKRYMFSEFENKRLQGFPDNWICNQKQIGNAVPAVGFYNVFQQFLDKNNVLK